MCNETTTAAAQRLGGSTRERFLQDFTMVKNFQPIVIQQPISPHLRCVDVSTRCSQRIPLLLIIRNGFVLHRQKLAASAKRQRAAVFTLFGNNASAAWSRKPARGLQGVRHECAAAALELPTVRPPATRRGGLARGQRLLCSEHAADSRCNSCRRGLILRLHCRYL